MDGKFPRTLKGRSFFERTVLLYVALGFAATVVIIWTNELFDVPHLLLGSPVTGVNWRESSLESISVVILGAVVMTFTWRFLARIKYLEGFLVVCAFCKKIKVDDDKWVPIEQFVRDHADVEFSHSYCPECLREHYGHFFTAEKRLSERHGSC